MIGGITLRQAQFISEAYDASAVDPIEDYPNNDGICGDPLYPFEFYV